MERQRPDTQLYSDAFDRASGFQLTVLRYGGSGFTSSDELEFPQSAGGPPR